MLIRTGRNGKRKGLKRLYDVKDRKIGKVLITYKRLTRGYEQIEEFFTMVLIFIHRTYEEKQRRIQKLKKEKPLTAKKI